MSYRNAARHSTLAVAAGAGLALMAAGPAYAATVVTPTLALVATQVGGCASSAGLAGGSESVRTLKAEAILGGAPSALERMRMSQAAPSTAGTELTAPATADSGNGTGTCSMVSASPTDGVELVASRTTVVASPVASRSTDFLGSARIPIGQTRFDAQWARVSSRRLSAQVVERSMGTPDGDQLALIEQVNRWANRTVAYRADSPRYHGGDYWAEFYPAVRDQLISRQAPDGSWQGEAGADYATAMALIILQMPNRYLPVYAGKGPGS